MNKSKYILTLFSSLLVAFGYSQNIEEDFARISKTYKTTSKVEIHQSLRYYSNHTSDTIVDEQKSVIKRSNHSFFSKSFGQERLLNNSYYLVADNINGLILVDKSQEGEVESFMNFDADSLLKDNTSHTFSKEGKLGKYELLYDTPPYSKIEVIFNTSDYYVRKIVMYRSSPFSREEDGVYELPRIEIENSVNLNPSFSDGVFSESKYLTKTTDQLELTELYKNYQLISLIK